ncbi:peptidoglycan DD-metalloendopeptidase family protein [Rhizosphaericola mali]|uniref:Peptidoglycan DD-metalloendopeptidase family protein n=1 Tax=Rhizosphaericola mali TaxID=2545455 RepID=A0A5P2G3P0_9BACT|nr:peptidoglycan DD-metalloendopeptidase family protein [Rhizosphaericola mali]QES87703.1 peptidoglycan DD-metalloendopeptidase family protein [Rhizosphaericola mali]
MKKLLLLFGLILITHISIGQMETEISKKVADQFGKYYNQNAYDSIFNMCSNEMQNVLPKDFLSNLKKDAGNIKERKFEKYENAYACYKTKFERAIFTVNLAIDDNEKIAGLFVGAYKTDSLPKLTRNKTSLILPFRGVWDITWGGDTKALNYHVENEAQKNAFDFVVKGNNGNTFKTDGRNNEDYYAFRKDISAPCDGVIVLTVDGVKDNIPGVFNPIFLTGNSVILKTENNEYLFFAHFKQHSIVVKEGQFVKQGQLLGLCGNSGNSSEPHLHFHIQNVEDMNVATGVKCYFSKILVNGQIKTDYSPIQNEKVNNF